MRLVIVADLLGGTMHNHLIYFILSAIVGAGATDTAATRIVEKQGTARQAQEYLAGYADCLVEKPAYAARVSALLRDVPGSATPGSAQIVEPQCLLRATAKTDATVEMRIPTDLYRLALYAALYKRDYGKVGPMTAISEAPPARLSTEFDGPVTSLPATYRPVRALGDCIARASPTGAHALLVAVPFTPAEDAALEGLKPALQGCLPADRTLTLNRGMLRGAVGEAAYKLALSVQPPRR